MFHKSRTPAPKQKGPKQSVHTIMSDEGHWRKLAVDSWKVALEREHPSSKWEIWWVTRCIAFLGLKIAFRF